MNLRDVLGLRPKADTSAALRTSLADTQSALATVRGVVAELEAGRGGVLLDGTADQAAQYEANLAEARAEAELFEAMAAALPARIAVAEARERGVELDGVAERAEADARAGAALVPGVIQGLTAVIDLMRQHDAITDNVLAANRELKDAGRPTIALPIRHALPDPKNLRPLKFHVERAPSGVGYGGIPSMGYQIRAWLETLSRSA